MTYLEKAKKFVGQYENPPHYFSDYKEVKDFAEWLDRKELPNLKIKLIEKLPIPENPPLDYQTSTWIKAIQIKQNEIIEVLNSRK